LAGHLAGGRAACEQAHKLCPPGDQECHAQALHFLAWQLEQEGELDAAYNQYREALAIYKLAPVQSKVLGAQVQIRIQLARLYAMHFGRKEAGSLYEQALATAAQTPDTVSRFAAENAFGLFRTMRGELKNALSSYGKARDLARSSALLGMIAMYNHGFV